jgi:hypothetical protein
LLLPPSSHLPFSLVGDLRFGELFQFSLYLPAPGERDSPDELLHQAKHAISQIPFPALASAIATPEKADQCNGMRLRVIDFGLPLAPCWAGSCLEKQVFIAARCLTLGDFYGNSHFRV